METSPASPPAHRQPPIPMTEFLRQRCYVEGACAIPVAMVAKVYEQWAADRGVTPLSPAKLRSNMLKMPGITISGSGRQALYLGVTLLEPDEWPVA